MISDSKMSVMTNKTIFHQDKTIYDNMAMKKILIEVLLSQK